MATVIINTIRESLEERWTNTRGSLISAIAGIMYFTGCWMSVDMTLLYSHLPGFRGEFNMCAVFGTISLIIINKISNKRLSGIDPECCPRLALYWMFLGLFIGCSAVLASLWVMCEYLSTRKEHEPAYPGVGIFLQNILIAASSGLLRFCRGNPDDIWT